MLLCTQQLIYLLVAFDVHACGVGPDSFSKWIGPSSLKSPTTAELDDDEKEGAGSRWGGGEGGQGREWG